MAFQSLKIGQRFTHKGTAFTKTCNVSAESTTYVQIFLPSDIITA